MLAKDGPEACSNLRGKPPAVHGLKSRLAKLRDQQFYVATLWWRDVNTTARRSSGHLNHGPCRFMNRKRNEHRDTNQDKRSWSLSSVCWDTIHGVIQTDKTQACGGKTDGY